MVMLSATVPNYREFADWVGRTKQRTVYTVSTAYRPTPLCHYLWWKDKPYLLMDNKGVFNTATYRKM